MRSNKIARNGQNVNTARTAFTGSSAHVYVQQMALADKPRYLVVNDDCYLAIIEPGRGGGKAISVLLETDPKGIRVTVDNKRVQLFSRQALSQPVRILAYLGLEDDDNCVFVQMCAAFAQAHQPSLDPVDVAQAIEREAIEKSERVSGHYNANLTDYDRQRLLKQAEREQEAARKRLAKQSPTPNGQYNGFGGPPSVGQQRQAVRDSLGRAIRPDPINLDLPRRDQNIRRK